MALGESDFVTAGVKVLEDLMDALEEGLSDYLEADIENGILTVELESGGQYAINLHRPNRQIWMSSPMSGASHFDYDETKGRWVSTRGGEGLHDMLSAELSRATGENVRFD